MFSFYCFINVQHFGIHVCEKNYRNKLIIIYYIIIFIQPSVKAKLTTYSLTNSFAWMHILMGNNIHKNE